jgi:hypothetical protein
LIIPTPQKEEVCDTHFFLLSHISWVMKYSKDTTVCRGWLGDSDKDVALINGIHTDPHEGPPTRWISSPFKKNGDPKSAFNMTKLSVSK